MVDSINFGNDYDLDEYRMSKDVDNHIGRDRYSNVNHPSHYATNGIECIDAMIASQGVNTVVNFCVCNAFKYIWRCTHKGKTLEDLQKAQWYLNKAINLIKKQ